MIGVLGVVGVANDVVVENGSLLTFANKRFATKSSAPLEFELAFELFIAKLPMDGVEN